MCLMDFVCYSGCGHTDYLFDQGGYCAFGFDAEKNSCSRGANEIRSVHHGPSVTSHCSACYQAGLTRIRAKHMERYCKVAGDAGERGMGKEEIKGELDEVLKGMMEAAMEWKIECALGGDYECRVNQY